MTLSAKTLMKYFPELEAEKAKELAKGMKATYSSNDHLADRERAIAVLKVFDRMMDNHGVEFINNNSCTRTYLFYSNIGDPYRITLLYYTKSGAYRLGCWGDWVSRNQSKVRS